MDSAESRPRVNSREQPRTAEKTRIGEGTEKRPVGRLVRTFTGDIRTKMDTSCKLNYARYYGFKFNVWGMFWLRLGILQLRRRTVDCSPQ